MKFEFDVVLHQVNYEGDEDDVQDFKCGSPYEFWGLVKLLLSPKDLDKLTGDQGVVFNVSKKRYLAGVEYINNNPFNRPKTTS